MNFTSWLSGLNRRITSRKRTGSQVSTPSVSVESMESRELLSISALFIPDTGELNIQLDSDDNVRIGSTVSGNVQIEVGAGTKAYSASTLIGSRPASDVTSIVVLGGDNQNRIDLSGVRSAIFTNLQAIEVDGANGHDTIVGSFDLADSLNGGNGDDTITGLGGNDTLIGGDGHDVITAGLGDDSIRSGDGNDAVTGDAGNDVIDSGNGDDTVVAGDGNDSVFAGNGQDSITGDFGNDTLNGDGGFDTVLGGDGDDLMLGGELNDLLEGGLGNDTLIGNAGNDTLIGVTGSDQIDGGVGNDLIQSALDIATDDAIPGAAAPAPVVPVEAPLPDVVDSTLGIDLGTRVTTIGTGTGDGSLAVEVSATGAFGLDNVPTSRIDGAAFDPLGVVGVSNSTYQSDVYFRLGTTTGPRVSLGTLATNLSTIRGTGTEANSTFNIGTLNFALTQLTEPMIDKSSGQQIGSLLTQSYRITNTAGLATQFELTRYLDGDLQFDGSLIDGGGRLVSRAGDEILYETDGGSASASTTMVGITAKGGTIPATNRYEIDQFPNLQNRLKTGTALDGQISNDLDGDQTIDLNYDVSLGLRNTFNLAGNATAVYTTHTLFATGTPDQLDLNLDPVAVADAGRVTAGRDVAVDVVSNDYDLDGSVIHSSLQVVQQPLFGTATPLADGRIRYTPNAGFSGSDTFFYTILDDLGAESNIAPVVMTVSAEDVAGDAMNGGLGNDTIIGSNGNDTILGGSGQDSLLGGSGNDRIQGQGGDDTLVGGGGSSNNLVGGVDSLDGGDGQDVMESLAARPIIEDITVVEGNVGSSIITFQITLPATILTSVALNYQTVSGTALAGQDYAATSGQLVFAAGETQKTVSVEVFGDVLGEPSEYFTLKLTSASGSLIEGAEATATILDDDVSVSIADVSAAEGNDGSSVMQFTVNLSVASTATVFVDFTTTDDDANAVASSVNILAPQSVFAITQDYAAKTGRVVILPGATSATIEVNVIGDIQSEDNERFFVNLSNAINADILKPQGIGTITNDDGGGPFLNPINDENFITLSDRWTSTATNGPGLVQGDATILTWGIVPDGTLVPDLTGALGPSDLIARLDFIYNESNTGLDVTNRTWFNFFVSMFDRFSSFSGTSYVFEPRDDRAPVDVPFTPVVSPGILNVRPDLRIGGTDIDGDGGVLAFNAFPQTGDMVIDTNDDTYLDLTNNSLIFRNVIAHEHGHGLGLRHVLPVTGTILMEPFLSTQFDGPQENDILATNRGYGDRFEKGRGNDTTAVASQLGTFSPASATSTAQFQFNQVSIDDDSDTDFYEFALTAPADVSISVDPTGSKYLASVQSQPNNLSPYNASTQVNLAFDVFAADGVTLLSSQNEVGFGLTESVSLTSLPAGKYFIRVTGTENFAQMYDLSVSASAAVIPTIADSLDQGDLHLGGNGADTILGAVGNDTLNGQGDNDSLLGGDGNDSLLGGAGQDTLDGQAGNDTLNGQSGNDTLLGGNDDDVFVLDSNGSGKDSADGQDGFNTIQVNGTNKVDAISVSQVGSTLTINNGFGTIGATQNIQNVAINTLAGNDTVTLASINGVSALQLNVNAGDGNDLLDATGALIGSVRLALNGGDGNDTLNGSLGNDSLNGGVGNDLIVGNPGNDVISGGDGNDVIGGGLGDDVVSGGDGADTINGQQGNDNLNGGNGNDTIKGDVGNDTIGGGAGDDSLNGMEGDDSILGGVGQDALSGGIGNDTLDGGRNDDTINGNAGDDLIRGDHGNDYLDAGEGNNTVNGGDGDDTILTEAGNDFVHGGDGNDRINVGDGNDVVVGGDGNDTVLGGAGNDTILGGDGDDSLDGQGGTDTIAGQQGNDTIIDPVAEIREKFVLPANILKILTGL